MLQVLGYYIRSIPRLDSFLFGLQFVRPHGRQLMINNFESLVRVNRRYIHRHHYIKISVRNIRQHIVFKTCGHILDEHGAGVLVAPHEVVLFELHVIGTTVTLVRAALELFCVQLRYLFVHPAENIL